MKRREVKKREGQHSTGEEKKGEGQDRRREEKRRKGKDRTGEEKRQTCFSQDRRESHMFEADVKQVFRINPPIFKNVI